MKNRNFTFKAIIVSAIFWLMDSAAHKFIYSEDGFEIIPSDINELWMRVVIAVLLVCFGIYADRYTKTMLQKESEKRIVLDELTTKNAQCQILVENAADGIFFYDEKTRFFGSNKHAQKVLGYTEEELNQLAVFDINKTLKPEQILPVLKALEPGEFSEFKGVHQRKDGTSFPVDVRVAAFLLNGEKRFVAIARDITESKQAEQLLAESELRFRTLSKHAPVGIFMTNLEGECVYVNEKWQQITGLSFEEAKGAGWTKALHEDDRSSLYSEWERFVKDGDEFSLEYRFVRPDKGDSWVSGKAISLQNPDGSLSGYLGTVTDITDIKTAEQQIIAARKEAESANQSKSEFLARMSHELRTPLNAVLGFAQLLRVNNQNLTDSQNLGVDHILAGGKHLLHLINEVLDLAKVDAGKLELSIEDVSLQDVISSSVALVISFAEKHEVSIDYPSEAAYQVRADRQKLEQVLVNLLSNAIKYNQKGGKVDINIEPVNDGMIRISVRDTGCGIKTEHQKNVYEPFRRVNSSAKSVEGTGMGLAIAKTLVEVMGGSIGLESEFGQGTTFWIDMHTVSALSPPKENLSQSHGSVVDTAATCDLKVLYVEDNPANMDLMQQILRQEMECDLLMATTAEKGLEIAKENSLDLILMDINLPGMDGVDALKTLKADIKTSHIPVVAVSAHAMLDQIESGAFEGFAGYLSKPFQVEELVNIIQEIVT